MRKFILLNFILFIVPVCCSKAITSGTVRIRFLNTDYALYSDLVLGDTTHLKVLLDTGSNELWVPSASCDTSKSWCQEKGKYDYLESHWYKKTDRNFSTSFADEKMAGRVGLDTLQIGSSVVRDMEFGEALSSAGDLSWGYYDGVLGLGPKKVSSVGSTYLQRLLRAGLDDAVFSFSLSDTSGTVTIGGVRHEQYRGSVVWSGIVRDDMWQIKADGISVGGESLCSADCQLEFNTGVELTAAPSAHVARLSAALGAREIPGTRIRFVECEKMSTFPALTLSVSGGQVRLEPRDYIFREKVADMEFCYLTITDMDELQDRWIMGAAAHRALYVVYDFGRNLVGLANAA